MWKIKKIYLFGCKKKFEIHTKDFQKFKKNVHLFLFKKNFSPFLDLFILFEKIRREAVRQRASICQFAPQMTIGPGPGWSRNFISSPTWYSSPGTRAVCCCFPGHSCRYLDCKWSRAWTDTHKGCWHQLNVPHYNTGPMFPKFLHHKKLTFSFSFHELFEIP